MKGRILLVDDNAAFIDTIQDILEEEGYRVETAPSGETAVESVRREAFDLVLMDIKMPGMNGVESFLRMKDVDPHIQVLLFTAYALDDLIEEAKSNGVLAVLKKPLDIDRLFTFLEETRWRRENTCILVVDDDRCLCENLLESLTESGYRVCVALNGQEAIRQAESRPFDILLLDMKLPECDGLQVYRRIKPLQPGIVTILITGYAEEMKALIGKVLSENADTVLTKPLDMRQLLQRLAPVAHAKQSQCR
ncbi:MAG: response regulator [Desulfatitalea sp.]|nr:response regulator [Desulfatitalea sp.]